MQSFDRSIFHSTSNSLGFSLAAQRKIWLIHVCKVGESVTSLRVFVVFWFLRGSLLQDFFESSYWSWMLLICNLSFCFLSFFILFTASYIKYPCAILASLESTIFFLITIWNDEHQYLSIWVEDYVMRFLLGYVNCTPFFSCWAYMSLACIQFYGLSSFNCLPMSTPWWKSRL